MKRLALALATCTAVSACGTTVPLAQRGAGGADGLAGQVAGGSSVSTAATATTRPLAPAGGSAPAAATSGSTASIPGANVVPGGSAPAALPPLPPGTTGRGFTKTVVKIGVATADDSGATVSSFGLKGFNAGDYHAQLNAVVDDLNRHGGLAGRRVELVIHDYNTSQTLSDPSTANQAACATWTQDNKVLAVLLPPIVTDNLLRCLQKGHTPLINAGIEFPRSYSALFRRYPDYFHLTAMVGELFDSIAMSRLKARGFFTGWNTATGGPGNAPVKVGVIIRNDEDGTTQERSYVRALAAVGITPASIDHCTSGVASSCMQSVELRYQTNHITHVVGNSELTFMNTAQAQNYHPRYFLPGLLDSFAQNAPKGQLTGAMAEGFLPTSDVPSVKDPGAPSAATGRCLALMRKVGQDTSSRATQLSMLTVCDAFGFLAAAVEVRGGLSDDVVRSGLEALGSSHPSALTWSTHLGPQQHTAVDGMRDLSYDSSCSCFGYTSKVTYTR